MPMIGPHRFIAEELFFAPPEPALAGCINDPLLSTTA
jgi:hypothetical protein